MSSQVFRDGLLDGQVAIVTGGGSGLERTTALELARLGASVVVCGRRSDPLHATAALDGAGRVAASVCDIREEDQVQRLVDETIDRHGRIDLLVNNVGGELLSPAEDITPKGFRTVMKLDVKGTWLMTHAVATRAMIPGGWGKIIASPSPHHGLPGMAHSSAARAAVDNLMRVLSMSGRAFTSSSTRSRPASSPPRRCSPIPAADRRLARLDRPSASRRAGNLAGDAAGLPRRRFSVRLLTIDGARDNWAGPWPPPFAALDDGQPSPKRAARRGSDERPRGGMRDPVPVQPVSVPPSTGSSTPVM